MSKADRICIRNYKQLTEGSRSDGRIMPYKQTRKIKCDTNIANFNLSNIAASILPSLFKQTRKVNIPRQGAATKR